MVNLQLQWLQEPWFLFIYFILVLFVLKPWLTFIREHGNSERILDALVVVKLLPTLKHVINLNTQKKFHRIMNVAYLKMTHGLRFKMFFCFLFFLAADCWCLFTGIVVHQLWSFAFSRKHESNMNWCERARVRMQEWRVTFFFFFFCGATWMVPPGIGALCRLRTLHIGSGGTVYCTCISI